MATLLLGLFFVRGRIGFGLHPDSGTWTCAISVLVYPEHPFSRVEAPNRLQTTYVPAEVSYLVEQLPHCDLLRLSLLTGDLSCQLDKSSKSYCKNSSTFPGFLKVVFFDPKRYIFHPTRRMSDLAAVGFSALRFLHFLQVWLKFKYSAYILHLSPKMSDLAAVRISEKRYIFHPVYQILFGGIVPFQEIIQWDIINGIC